MQKSPAAVHEQNSSPIERIGAAPQQPCSAEGHALRAIGLAGRSTGRARRTPIAVTEAARERHPCSSDRERARVRTLPTAGTCNVLRTDTASHRAVLAEGRQAATLFEAHPSALRLPFTVEQLPVIADDSAEDISAHTKQAAIFRLEVT